MEKSNKIIEITGDGISPRALGALKKVGDSWLDGKIKIKQREGSTSCEQMESAVDPECRPLMDLDKTKQTFHHKVSVPIDTLRELTLGMADSFDNCSIILSGSYEYPVHGYMGWHTNSEAPGLRMYASYATGVSAFRYMDDAGDSYDSMDDLGWNFRLFNVTKENPLWHCVWAESPRLSIGFRIINNL